MERACDGLVWRSEIDADLVPFLGQKATLSSRPVVRKLTSIDRSTPIEGRRADDLFVPFALPKEWNNDNQKQRAEKFDDSI